MCSTLYSPLLPPLKFQDIDAQSPRCRLADVLLPVQPYLSYVRISVTGCTNDISLTKHRELKELFNSRNVDSDLWYHEHSVGRAIFQKIVNSVHKSSQRGVKATTSSRSAPESESTSSTRSPGNVKRKVFFDSDPISDSCNS